MLPGFNPGTTFKNPTPPGRISTPAPVFIAESLKLFLFTAEYT